MIVHIGFPKTGSSYLQAAVFPNLKNIHYTRVRPSVALFHELLYRDETEYSVDKFMDHKNHIGETASYQLYSLEQLVGRPFHDNGGNRTRSAHRLKELGFTKVMLTIRSQFSIIDSMYRDYIRQGGVLKFKNFFYSDHYAQREYFLLEYLNYAKVADLYVELFGKENVLILLHEELKQSKENAIQKICAFCEKEYIPDESLNLVVNKSLSNFSTSLMRVSNHFSCNNFKPANLISNEISSGKFRYALSVFDKLGFGRSNFVNGDTKEEVRQYYHQGNHSMANQFDLPLEKFEYPL